MTRRHTLYLILSFVFFRCSKDVGTVNTSSYPDHINAIIRSNCAVQGCHNTASRGAAAGLDLSTWSALFEGANSGSPVIPYSSKYSSLMYFINTFEDLGPVNFPTMPLNKPALSREQVQQIAEWIGQGAPDRNGSRFWEGDPLRRKYYVVNQGCDVVTVLDAATQLPIRYIELGKGAAPHQVRVSPDGKFWFVVFINRNYMKKFRCSDDAFVADIPLSPLAAGTGHNDALNWNTFVITRDGRYAYCVSWTNLGFVSKVDLQAQQLLFMKPAGFGPHGICLGADESKVYVAAQSGNYITEFDSDFTSDQSYSLDGNPVSPASSLDGHDMILSPDGNSILITCQGTNELRVFDLSLKKTTRVMQTPVYPQEILYAPVGGMYYVSCMGDGSVAHPGELMAVEAGSYAVKTLRIGAQPHGLAVDENKGLICLLSRNVSSNGPVPHHSSQCEGKNGFLSFIDQHTFKPIGRRCELSVDPYFIYLRP